MNKRIYLDYAATTPVDVRVAECMSACLTIDGAFANSSSDHAFGYTVKNVIEAARQQVADLIGADSKEIIWTSGATESINLALKGVAQLYQQKGKHIVTVKTEHPAVLDCCEYLEKLGFQVTYLSPENNGLLDLEKLKQSLRPDTILVSVMHVNNEIGVIQDIQAIGQHCLQRGILFHVDAAQSVGKVAIDVSAMPIDLLSMCAHKVYGPKGIGALYVRKKPRVRVAAQMQGGGQEWGMRSGTLPQHQIVGMGEAFAIAKREMQQDNQRLLELRNLFLSHILKNKQITLNGHSEQCVPGILNITVAGMHAKEIVKAVPDLAISVGSACSTKGDEPSYVLRALGLSYEAAASSVRISLGRYTTHQDIEVAIKSFSSLLHS